MEIISIFDMLKIGIGPSSSHTLGPWKAANRFIEESEGIITNIRIELYGSLSLTGIGHATDIALALGLSGEIPEDINPDRIPEILEEIKTSKTIYLGKKHHVPFSLEKNILFLKKTLPFHSNGMKFIATINGVEVNEVFYSIF